MINLGQTKVTVTEFMKIIYIKAIVKYIDISMIFVIQKFHPTRKR